MIINLTPHPIRVFNSETPDTIDGTSPGLDSISLTMPVETKFRTAHLRELELGTVDIDGISVENVSYGLLAHIPPQVANTYYIVPLATALACKRNDFLVPYRVVRNMDGTV